MKIRKIKSVQEWTADVAKKLHPYSKTLKAVDWYFATAGYEAAKVEISGNYSITIYDN